MTLLTKSAGLTTLLLMYAGQKNRNMRAYLDLLAQGKIHLDPLLNKTYPVDQAHQAYQALKSAPLKPLGVLLSYPKSSTSPTMKTRMVAKKKRRIYCCCYHWGRRVC